MANSGGMVGMITSGRSVQAALGSADARLLVRRSPPRLDFRQIAGMRADGPTPRKSRVIPSPESSDLWLRRSGRTAVEGEAGASHRSRLSEAGMIPASVTLDGP